jgi:hypothetical protein
MMFPLGFLDISLLLAVTAMILLITSELLSPYFGVAHMKINRKNLKNAATVFSILFLATVIIEIVSIILNP